MSKRDQVYVDEFKVFVVKTVWKWKRTFHFNLQIQKEYIIFYHIWSYFVYFREGFPNDPQSNSSSAIARSYTYFRHRIGGV